APPTVTEQPVDAPPAPEASGDGSTGSPEPRPIDPLPPQPQASPVESVVTNDPGAPATQPRGPIRLARSSRDAPPAMSVSPPATGSESSTAESSGVAVSRRPPPSPAGPKCTVSPRPVRLQRRARPATAKLPTGPTTPEPSPPLTAAADTPTTAPNAAEPVRAESSPAPASSPAALAPASPPTPGLLRRALSRFRSDRAAGDEPGLPPMPASVVPADRGPAPGPQPQAPPAPPAPPRQGAS